MADAPIDCDFPIWGLLPKKETGVVSFLNKYPEYDGRGTVIAIFDSGVDPAAPGLEVTSTNETKVIERFDCSGCGDVDTSTVIRTISADGCITGLTGRKLKIPEDWVNPTNEWRVGVLYPFSIYPTKVKERIQEHRKEHLWDIGHKKAYAEANKKLQDVENEIGSKTSTLSMEDKMQKEELEARVEVLQAAEKKYVDYGPTYDCVLYHDGTVWRACIDTTERGALAAALQLPEYSASRQHRHLTPLDEMTVSVNVHDAGDTLEVVGMCSTHGTHVAAIAAGYFPNEPEQNGVAPGAKIISLTIGDSRLGSMETGTALVRACIKVMELSKKMNIDVINMSYGEHAHWSNAGRVGDIIGEVVSRYGASWVVSAGNHGPALGTVGAPPDIAHPVLLGVGAYVSPEMGRAAYSLRARLPGGAFSWSSRGPAADGALGVAVCAPGGAVASVARFTLRNSQLMNGTSMAAPHVAGAVAALISGLKAQSLPYSPYSIKRGLENSATYLEHVEPWAQGCGLLNIEKAFELLSTYHSEPERDVTFSVQCAGVAGSAGGGSGVLVRVRDNPPRRSPAAHDLALTVEPRFLHRHTDVDKVEVMSTQLSFKVRVSLTAPAWVSCAAHLELPNAPRPLAVRIDTGALPPGPHFGSINAYDVQCVGKGPVFRIPVTVLVPQPLEPRAGPPSLAETRLLFKPSTIIRRFVTVPSEATWAVVRLSPAEGAEGAEGAEVGGRFLVHAMQLVPRRSCRSHETQKMVSLTADAPTIVSFPVLGDVMLEVVIAKYWANIGDLLVDYTIEFHGLKPDFGTRMVFSASEGVRGVMLSSLRLEEVQPNAQLKYVEPVLRPSESKISPLTPRDVIPPARQIYQLVNTYNFHLAKATEVSPIVSLLSDMLYESEFESQLWMLYNSCKQLMAVGDAYPSKYSVKLEKGEYVVRLCVRHDNRALLERIQDLTLVVQQRLAQPLVLDAYAAHSQALTGGKKFSTGSVSSGSLLPIYFTALPADKISRSWTGAGLALSGSVSFAREEGARRAGAWPLVYVPCEPPRRAPPAKEKRPLEDYQDAYKDFVTTWLPKLEGEKLEQVYEELTEKFPDYLGAHIAYLNAIDSPTDHKRLPHADAEPDVTKAFCEQIVAIADKVISQIDQEKLLAYLGTKNDTRSDAAKIKQEQERRRGLLVEALSRRGAALVRLRAPLATRALQDLLKYADLTDAKAIQYGVWQCFGVGHWARAARLLARLQEERPSRDLEDRLLQAYRKLGWEYMASFAEAALPVKYPASYRPF